MVFGLIVLKDSLSRFFFFFGFSATVVATFNENFRVGWT